MVKVIKDTADFLRHFWQRHERHASSVALLVGFIIDYFTLTRIDGLFDNLVLIFYLTVIALGIIFMHFYYSARRMRMAPVGSMLERFFGFIKTFAPVVIQFAVGGVMSGLVVFYSRSTTLGGSWPFLLLLVGFMIGNEFLQARYQRLTFQISVWYFVLLSYLIFAVPMVIGEIGTSIFILSGLISLVIVAVFVRIISRIVPERYERSGGWIMVSIGSILIAVNALYFYNIIPPVPLALKHADVYHSVVRTGATYTVKEEPDAWYEWFMWRDTFHATSPDRVFAYSAIFAPRGLTTDVTHTWQKYNEVTEAWDTVSTIPLPVVGGREGGFRGFTYTDRISPGAWRVNIRTQSGALIGRIGFDVETVPRAVETETVILE